MMARTLNAEQIVTNQGSANDDSLEKIESNETENNADDFWETDEDADNLPDEKFDAEGNSGSTADSLPAVLSTVDETTTVETATTQDAPSIEAIQSSAETTKPIAETPTEIIWDEAVERAKDEKEFFEQLKQARHELNLAESTWENAKSNVKIAKEEYTLAQAALYDIAEEGVVYRQKPEPPKPIVVVVAVAKTPSEVAKEDTPASSPAPTPNTNEDWKKIETSTILAGIEGLGAKKRQSLIDGFPTFEKLMDARTESSKEFVPFHSLLPKGIGESIGTEIINRMDKAIVPGM